MGFGLPLFVACQWTGVALPTQIVTPDLNLSGTVDFYDFSLFSNQFGWSAIPGQPYADFNLDGVVNLPDFQILTNIMFPRCNPGDPCLDTNLCTADGCAPAGYCFHQPIPNCCAGPQGVQKCIDANICNEDLCVDGYCLHPPLKCDPIDCRDDKDCTFDWCLCGSCAHLDVPGCCDDDTDCDDGIACTRNECVNGTCTYTPDDLLCNPGAMGQGNDPDADCLWLTCSPTVGCVPGGSEADGSPCVDSVACTTADFCSGGGCYGGGADHSLCPNQDLCDADCIVYRCDPTTGCVPAPEPYGNSCSRDCPPASWVLCTGHDLECACGAQGYGDPPPWVCP